MTRRRPPAPPPPHPLAPWLENPDRPELLRLMQAGDLAGLEEAAALVEGFPEGGDLCGPWLSQALVSAPRAVILWMLSRGVPLRGPDGGGAPLLCGLIDAPRKDRHALMRLLIAAGAPLDERGVNGWTALHLAAMRDDVEAMEILLQAGASRAARTGCDDDATPEEEARQLGHTASADFLRDWTPRR